MDSSLYQFPKNDKKYERVFEIYVKDNHNKRMLMTSHKTDIEFDENKLRQELHDRVDDLLDKLWKTDQQK